MFKTELSELAKNLAVTLHTLQIHGNYSFVVFWVFFHYFSELLSSGYWVIHLNLGTSPNHSLCSDIITYVKKRVTFSTAMSNFAVTF